MPAVYLFRCRDCGRRHAGFDPDPKLLACESCGSPVIRDYRAEGVNDGASAKLKREREGKGDAYMRDQFLPTAKDYAGPGDPDGSKGLREWNDTHGPREGNKNPLRPEVPKRVF